MIKVGKIDLNNAVLKKKKSKKNLIQSKEKKENSLIIVSKKPLNSMNGKEAQIGETIRIPSHIKAKGTKKTLFGAAVKSEIKQGTQNMNKRIQNLQ